jgi:hypothetical protein
MPAPIAVAAAWIGKLGLAAKIGLFVGGQVLLSTVERALISRGTQGAQVPPLQRRTVTTTGGVTPRRILYGSPWTGGQVVFRRAVAPEKLSYWTVYAIAGHEIDGFTSLVLDDYPLIDLTSELDGSGDVTDSAFVDADGNKLVRVKLFTGTDDQTADTELVSAFPGIWTADHRLRGVAYLAIRITLDTTETAQSDPDADVWENGLPQRMLVKVRGKKV